MPLEYTLHWDDLVTTEKTKAGMVRALRLATERLLQLSRQVVPHERGDLERSGVAAVDESTFTGAVSYDEVYAADQHESTTYRHEPGRTDHYLSGPLAEHHEDLLQIVADAIAAEWSS